MFVLCQLQCTVQSLDVSPLVNVHSVSVVDLIQFLKLHDIADCCVSALLYYDFITSVTSLMEALHYYDVYLTTN